VRRVVAILILAIILSSGISISASAKQAELQLQIQGIECDLEAIYNGQDPSTVVVPDYCSNAPDPVEPETPTEETPAPITTTPEVRPFLTPAIDASVFEYTPGFTPSQDLTSPSDLIDSEMVSILDHAETFIEITDEENARNIVLGVALVIIMTTIIDILYFNAALARNIFGAISRIIK